MGSKMGTPVAPARPLRTVTYNVYFGTEPREHHEERTRGIIDLIVGAKADIVCLQEVIDRSNELFAEAAAKHGYVYFSPAGSPGTAFYYNAVMIGPGLEVVKTRHYPYKLSRMGRHALIATCKRRPEDGGGFVVVGTSHLESMRDNAGFRLAQVSEAHVALKSAARGLGTASCQPLVLFMGDTDLEKGELEGPPTVDPVFGKASAPSLPPGWVDIWRDALGQPAATRHTWDMQANDMFPEVEYEEGRRAQKRLDRVYAVLAVPAGASGAGDAVAKAAATSPAGFGAGLVAGGMSLLGTDRLPCGVFPSDHYGVIVDWMPAAGGSGAAAAATGGAGVAAAALTAGAGVAAVAAPGTAVVPPSAAGAAADA
jgi:tyrosyl-DNA phosphodiesterase 2